MSILIISTIFTIFISVILFGLGYVLTNSFKFKIFWLMYTSIVLFIFSFLFLFIILCDFIFKLIV